MNPLTQETYAVHPIGVIHCEITSREMAPKNYDISDYTGVIEIFSQYKDAMDGIEVGTTIVALFWLHQAKRDVLKVYPRGDKSRGLRGVFSTRSPMRPNPIAVSEYKILEINGLEIKVTGVDMIDGTPLVDLKKKV
ncbi:MAG: tRNA (N6-threonylcarbamoyladenosine(37)-N6)-methyltransferase TrmO [Proteobacteria bacterium]|nr:tRNA (N6-threonylcarbamoyladenosine(37)-N6)-methyltransferase TrmO [Pseudomonadota bacterium]MBU1710361.1 tRNA (N6-threonylcarbamoyladenosine(37)-N6)-methyltransferase TrmO [Pseudomonadota bacterium]